MTDAHTRLAARLDDLGRALLAAETYLTQLRTVVAEIRADLERLAARQPPAGPPGGGSPAR